MMVSSHMVAVRSLGFLSFVNVGFNGLFEKYFEILLQPLPGCTKVPHPSCCTHHGDPSYHAGMQKECFFMSKEAIRLLGSIGAFAYSLCTEHWVRHFLPALRDANPPFYERQYGFLRQGMHQQMRGHVVPPPL